SMSSAFIRSTIEVRHSSFSCLAAAALSRIGATSTLCAGAGVGAAAATELPPRPDTAAPPVGAEAAEWLKIALMIFPKMLIMCSPMDLETRYRVERNGVERLLLPC